MYLLPARHRNKVELVLSIPCFIIIRIWPLSLPIRRRMADEVADGLIAKGLKVGRIHGDLSPRERKKMMKQIHRFRISIYCCNRS